MNNNHSIVITGASGFIGRTLLESMKDEFTIYAIARRSRKEANIPYHKNINWIQCDIADNQTLNEVTRFINERGGADFVIHLAAFYDFTYKDNIEYQRTNIDGTKNTLEFARAINVKRFLFASSLAACNFPKEGEAVNENSTPDADFAYARSKKIGESLVKTYSNYFPCSVIRFAAVYSDWCEYAPLYKFISRWLSRKIDSRMLAGKGESAIPYIHVQDIVSLIKTIIKKSNDLGRFEIFNASPDGSSSHKELYEITTSYFYGKTFKPIYIPKLLAYPGLAFIKLLRHLHLFCEEPFEKFWMIKYIDKKLNVDASYTRERLGWEPAKRYHIARRLLFLLEKLKSHPDEWRLKNEVAMHRVARRINLIIYKTLSEMKEAILQIIISKIKAPENRLKFERYNQLDPDDFQCYISTLYHLLMATVRSGDRSLMIQYIDEIALKRFAEGFEPAEICETLSIFKKVIVNELNTKKELKKIGQDIYDHIGLTLQLAEDEVEDLYDRLIQKMPTDKISDVALLPDCKELQKLIRQLSAFYQIAPDNVKQNEHINS
ncbi:NAD-dependent epimerase/dehydratase family protein [Melioribacter sp. OK-6-Me]|uniref:NAD-dependent epimerase/dehydratase family protein n=1 Tax=unclassified Melioribacter TaxID=2627329 RepID=UPI003EDA4EF9